MQEGQQPLQALGGHIRAAREEAGLSEEALAERLGLSTVTVYLWESGTLHPGARLQAIAQATGKELSWFATPPAPESAPPAHIEPRDTAPAGTEQPEQDLDHTDPFEGSDTSEGVGAVEQPAQVESSLPQPQPAGDDESDLRLGAERVALETQTAETVEARRELAWERDRLAERERALAERGAALARERDERELELAAREAELDQRAVLLDRERHSLALERDTLADQGAAIAERETALAREAEELERELGVQRAALEIGTGAADEARRELAWEQDRLAERERALAERDAALARELEERELELASREAEFEKRAAELDEWAAALEQRASALDRDSALLAGERVRLRRILETGVTAPDTDVVIDTSTKQANALGISSSAVTRRLSRLDLSPFPNIATAREVGGQTIVATLIDGKAVRITARRDWVNDIFSSQYETAEPGSLSWVESHDYRTCTSPTVTGLLAAALKEVDLGPHRDEFAGEILGDPSDGGAEYEHMSPPIVDATAEDSRPSAGKPRRRFWKPRRG